MNSRKKLLLVYHSMTGGTQQMTQACARGAGAEGVEAVMLHAPRAQAADVLAADGFVFASPENLAAVSGLLKDFFDRTYYQALERVNGRPYAAMICAGSDGRQAAQQIVRVATGWRLRGVADPLIVCTHAQSPDAILAPKRIGDEDLSRCEDLGRTLGAGLKMGIF